MRIMIHCAVLERILVELYRSLMENTWVTLWWVTLANHNVTHVQRNKKKIVKEKEERHL